MAILRKYTYFTLNNNILNKFKMKNYFYFPKNIRNGILLFILLVTSIIIIKYLLS